MEQVENPQILSASAIKGCKLINRNGEDLGKIEELMIDLEECRIAYAVLSFGGFLGLGNKLFAIPLQAFSLKAYEHTFVLDISKDVLEKAEGFEKDNWPITHERLEKIYTYYGYKPYWETEEEKLVRLENERVEETELKRMARIERERLGSTETEGERKARLEKEQMKEQRL